ncbi:MAG: helix-turn-helix domain-containing protein [Actinomycetota bacterium]|nr:helix-turn-helix domain-containing protein [Actinomycetota bacterium]
MDPEGVGEVGATGGSGGLSPEDLRRVEVLGRKIKDHRERHSLIQEEFAKACGLSRSVVAHIERGVYLPGKRSRRKIAEALGIPVEELFELPREERG